MPPFPELETLKKDISKLREDVRKPKLPQLTYPVDPETLRTLSLASDAYMPDKIFDLTWRKTYRFSTVFESLDGYYKTAGVSLDNVIFANSVQMFTDGTLNNLQELQKIINVGSFFTFSQKSSFHTFIYPSQNTNQTIYVLMGEKTVSPFYGFKIVNGIIYGVASPAGTASETTVKLNYDSFPTTSALFLEARFIPNVGAKFITRYVNAAGTATEEHIGVISDPTALPAPTPVPTNYLFDITLQADDAVIKKLNLSTFEFIQFRNVLQ